MLIPNTTGHVAHTSRKVAVSPGPVAETGAGAVGVTAPPVEVVRDSDDQWTVQDLEIIGWQEREDGRVVPLVVNTDGTVADATGIEGFEGVYPAPRAVAAAGGWFAEFLTPNVGTYRVPVAVWATWAGEVVGMVTGADAAVTHGQLTTSGDRDLHPVAGENFIRYVHQSGISGLTGMVDSHT